MEQFTSSSDTPKFLSTCLACFRDNLRRSASVPVTVFCFLIWGELVVESSYTNKQTNKQTKTNTQTKRSLHVFQANTEGANPRKIQFLFLFFHPFLSGQYWTWFTWITLKTWFSVVDNTNICTFNIDHGSVWKWGWRRRAFYAPNTHAG